MADTQNDPVKDTGADFKNLNADVIAFLKTLGYVINSAEDLKKALNDISKGLIYQKSAWSDLSQIIDRQRDAYVKNAIQQRNLNAAYSDTFDLQTALVEAIVKQTSNLKGLTEEYQKHVRIQIDADKEMAKIKKSLEAIAWQAQSTGKKLKDSFEYLGKITGGLKGMALSAAGLGIEFEALKGTLSTYNRTMFESSRVAGRFGESVASMESQFSRIKNTTEFSRQGFAKLNSMFKEMYVGIPMSTKAVADFAESMRGRMGYAEDVIIEKTQKLLALQNKFPEVFDRIKDVQDIYNESVTEGDHVAGMYALRLKVLGASMSDIQEVMNAMQPPTSATGAFMAFDQSMAKANQRTKDAQLQIAQNLQPTLEALTTGMSKLAEAIGGLGSGFHNIVAWTGMAGMGLNAFFEIFEKFKGIPPGMFKIPNLFGSAGKILGTPLSTVGGTAFGSGSAWGSILPTVAQGGTSTTAAQTAVNVMVQNIPKVATEFGTQFMNTVRILLPTTTKLFASLFVNYLKPLLAASQGLLGKVGGLLGKQMPGILGMPGVSVGPAAAGVAAGVYFAVQGIKELGKAYASRTGWGRVGVVGAQIGVGAASIAGGILGGTIGSFAGPIGTAIGAVVGAYLAKTASVSIAKLAGGETDSDRMARISNNASQQKQLISMAQVIRASVSQYEGNKSNSDKEGKEFRFKGALNKESLRAMETQARTIDLDAIVGTGWETFRGTGKSAVADQQEKNLRMIAISKNDPDDEKNAKTLANLNLINRGMLSREQLLKQIGVDTEDTVAQNKAIDDFLKKGNELEQGRLSYLMQSLAVMDRMTKELDNQIAIYDKILGATDKVVEITRGGLLPPSVGQKFADEAAEAAKAKADLASQKTGVAISTVTSLLNKGGKDIFEDDLFSHVSDTTKKSYKKYAADIAENKMANQRNLISKTDLEKKRDSLKPDDEERPGIEKELAALNNQINETEQLIEGGQKNLAKLLTTAPELADLLVKNKDNMLNRMAENREKLEGQIANARDKLEKDTKNNVPDEKRAEDLKIINNLLEEQKSVSAAIAEVTQRSQEQLVAQQKSYQANLDKQTLALEYHMLWNAKNLELAQQQVQIQEAAQQGMGQSYQALKAYVSLLYDQLNTQKEDLRITSASLKVAQENEKIAYNDPNASEEMKTKATIARLQAEEKIVNVTKQTNQTTLEILEKTKTAREGWMDSMKEMAVGAGEFGALISTKDMAVTQMLHAGMPNTFARGGIGARQGEPGQAPSVQFTPNGMNVNPNNPLGNIVDKFSWTDAVQDKGNGMAIALVELTDKVGSAGKAMDAYREMVAKGGVNPQFLNNNFVNLDKMGQYYSGNTTSFQSPTGTIRRDYDPRGQADPNGAKALGVGALPVTIFGQAVPVYIVGDSKQTDIIAKASKDQTKLQQKMVENTTKDPTKNDEQYSKNTYTGVGYSTDYGVNKNLPMSSSGGSAMGSRTGFGTIPQATGRVSTNNYPARHAYGGWANYFSNGGHIIGPGGSKEDKIPALLSNGEYVINARSAKIIGDRRLQHLNRLADGGKPRRMTLAEAEAIEPGVNTNSTTPLFDPINILVGAASAGVAKSAAEEILPEAGLLVGVAKHLFTKNFAKVVEHIGRYGASKAVGYGMEAHSTGGWAGDVQPLPDERKGIINSDGSVWHSSDPDVKGIINSDGSVWHSSDPDVGKRGVILSDGSTYHASNPFPEFTGKSTSGQSIKIMDSVYDPRYGGAYATIPTGAKDVTPHYPKPKDSPYHYPKPEDSPYHYPKALMPKGLSSDMHSVANRRGSKKPNKYNSHAGISGSQIVRQQAAKTRVRDAIAKKIAEDKNASEFADYNNKLNAAPKIPPELTLQFKPIATVDPSTQQRSLPKFPAIPGMSINGLPIEKMQSVLSGGFGNKNTSVSCFGQQPTNATPGFNVPEFKTVPKVQLSTAGSGHGEITLNINKDLQHLIQQPERSTSGGMPN